MPQISIHDIALDSVLAEPILDRAGRIILPSGTRLTPTIVRRLELWSVATVSIEGVTPTKAPLPTGDEPPAVSAAPAPNEDGREEFPWTAEFRPHRDNPQMQLIERALDLWHERRRRERNRS